MKYLFSLLAGLVTGAALIAAGLYFNPMTQHNVRVPLTASPDESAEVFYRTDADTVLRIGPMDGLLISVPRSAPELWEPALASTEVRLMRLRDVDGAPIGLGVRFATLSGSTRPLTGELLLDSVWNVHLNDRGSLFVDALDNLWPLARGVLLPAWRADDRRWQGRFEGDITVGPGATHVAYMSGGAGVFAGTRGEARESLAVQALSLEEGPLRAEGSLLIAITGPAPGPGTRPSPR